MSVLVLNANTASPITVVCQRAGKGVPRRVGSKTYSFAGAERSSVRGQAKVIPITTSYVDTATEALIQNAGYNGAALPCSGDILGNIQTVCSFENVVSNMMPGLPGFFEMSFTLNEVQPSGVLLKYAPGDAITGESFARSTVGYQINAAGVLVQKAINVKRDGHFIGGVQSLLLEDAATNSLIQSRDFSNVAWTKVTTTVATGIADPAGGTGACTLTATGANATTTQSLATGSSIVRANSVWLRRRTGTGTINLITPDGGTFIPCTLTATWARFKAVGVASINRQFQIQIVTNGDAIDADFSQIDNTPFATSEIATTTVAVTRGADSDSLPFTTPPGEYSIYLKFVELGVAFGGGAPRLWSIGNAAPSLEVFGNGNGTFSLKHSNGSSTETATNANAVTLSAIVETLSRLYGDAGVEEIQSVGGAASTTSGQGAQFSFATAWSQLLFWVGSSGGGAPGYLALQSLKIVAGMRSLAEMQAA